jgi:lysozyme
MDIDALAATLIQDEGFRGVPYTDSEGKVTIAYGRNLTDRPLTPAEGYQLLINVIESTRRELDTRLPWWENLSDVRQQVIANMAYNLGVPRLLGFVKMLAAAKRGDFDTAANEMLNSLWAQQVGDRAVRLAAKMRHG